MQHIYRRAKEKIQYRKRIFNLIQFTLTSAFNNIHCHKAAFQEFGFRYTVALESLRLKCSIFLHKCDIKHHQIFLKVDKKNPIKQMRIFFYFVT